jgi:hypothetical protein
MVKKKDKMRGIHLNPESGHVYLNESYDKFLKTMYGRKFSPHFVAMINDLLDSGIIETLDDMKKVIKFFEWRIERKDGTIKNLISYTATLEESLQRVKEYAEGLEKRFAETRERAEALKKEVRAFKRGRARAMDARTTPTEEKRSIEEILTDLKGTTPLLVGEHEKAGADIVAGAEIDADEMEGEIEPMPVRPKEMEVSAREGGRLQAMGARLVEAEIDSDDIDVSPQIREIADKIQKVKGMEALHSDEEIEKIFEEEKRKDIERSGRKDRVRNVRSGEGGRKKGGRKGGGRGKVSGGEEDDVEFEVME